MTNTIKWDKPCYKCLSHLCDLSCKETSKTEEQDDEVLGFNGWGFPIEKPNKVMTTQTEALKLALEALEDAQYFVEAELNDRMDLYKNYPNLAHKYAGEQESLRKNQEAITAIKEALAQPEQEPVAWMYPDALCDKACLYLCTKGFTQFPECATPPQRTWVWLTDEDRQRAFESMPDMLDGFLKTWGWLHFAKAIEEISKEKNT